MTKKKEEGVIPEVLEGAAPVAGEKGKKTEDGVLLTRDEFNKLMGTIEKLSKDTDLLYKASDKHRIAKARNEGGEILIKQAGISTWGDKGPLVIAWKLVTNRSEVILGKWHEEQDVVVIFENGETHKASLLEFYRMTLHKVKADIVGQTEDIDSEGNKVTKLKMMLPSGQKIEISSSFLN